MYKIQPDYSTVLMPGKVFIIWKTTTKNVGIGEYTETELAEIYSDIDKAWDRHIELGNKTGRHVSYSIEVKEVKT